MRIKKKETFKIIGIVILAVIVFYGINKIFNKHTEQNINNYKNLKPESNYYETDLETKLNNYAKNLNKYTPIPIDEYSILDSVTTKKGKRYLVFHHTLTHRNESELNYDTLNKYIRSVIIENIEDPKFKIFNENKISIDYRYYGENGRLITELAVTNKPKPDNKNTIE